MGMRTLTRGEVFERYGVELTRFATSLVGPSDAQDVVSDALLSSMWSDGWENIDNQRAYLYRAITTQARMNHRASSRRRERESKTAGSVRAPDFHSGVDVWEALGHLDLSQRAIVFLMYWEDLPEASVADCLGMSERTVRRHLSRGRKKLGRLLI